MRMQRSGFPLMVLAAIALLGAVAAVLFLTDTISLRGLLDAVTAEPAAEAPAEPEPAPPLEPDLDPDPPPEPTPDAEPSVAQEIIPAVTHTVRRTDTLFDLAGEYWSDPFLWPVILEANEDRTVDPDYLRPGQPITIPQWVTVESGLTDEQRRTISRAHVLAYRYYRSLGSEAIGLGRGQPAWWLAQLGRIRFNKAMWVLYSGLRYDEALLSRFEASIRDEDARQVRAFVNRFGLPPTRR